MTENRQRGPYRVGIVGAGGIARTHATVLTERLDSADLVAICDVSPPALATFGDRFGVDGRFLHLDQMLDKVELDFIIICNWGIDHARTVIQAAESGQVRGILCEKPFAMNAGEAEAMAAAAVDNDILLGEAYKFRHHPMHLKAKEMVEAGAIGEVVSVRSTLITGRGRTPAHTRTPESDWRFNRAKGGGSINDVGCYCTAQARFIFGEEPERVFAQPQMGIEVDDGAAALLVFPGGRTAQFTVGFNAWHSQSVEISGTTGSLALDKPWNNSDDATMLEHITAGTSTTIHFEPLLQFTHQLQHFCDCLTTGEPYRIPLQDSINQMKALDALNESAATGQLIEL